MREVITSSISELIDSDYGSDTVTTMRYHDLKDAIEVHVMTTIASKRHDFWYFYPLWWVQDHRIERKSSEELDINDLIDSVAAAAALEFVWSYHSRPESGLVSAYKQILEGDRAIAG